MFTTENAEISDDFWKRRTQLYCMYCKRAFFIKARKYRRFGNVRIIICWHKKSYKKKLAIASRFCVFGNLYLANVNPLDEV